ncbi:diaminopimelate epimerase [Pseudonocardia acaciae]|uniref:diaminopimelate epimerase n=1 Tax=Pseudonocardia acaciae TaxID=551276 RepID=UPI000A011890|nr:diaminopimelate epimerase [Pseudonocardia acaciae]
MADPEAGIAFRKGHGTENDFVLLPDPDGALELTPARVRALCDRRRGLGADGVLRVVRSAALGEREPTEAEWFMDYRNADGSVAEMCGNGVRVFARYLAEAGLVDGDELVVATRGGPKPVRFLGDSGEIAVAMGAVRLGGASAATVGGRKFDGLVVDVGNPHLACVTDAALDELDLTVAPGYDAEVFPSGVNVEFVTPLAGGEARMRVYERGVGETRSCGTGTVAAAAAALRHDGRSSGTVTVHVPGGRLRVELADGTATLTGPAVLVAAGEIDPDWWRSAR